MDEFRAARAKRSPAEREELERLWQDENVEAIADYNRYVEKHGLPLAKYRPF
ncbi:MAG: type II toxin-antitoxin system CcdA family antitoxin [Achromobacter pestifer]